MRCTELTVKSLKTSVESEMLNFVKINLCSRFSSLRQKLAHFEEEHGSFTSKMGLYALFHV